MEYQQDEGPATEREWRCPQCGTLHGVVRGGKLHLKYKTAQFVVTGHVMAVCRRCSQLSETTVAVAPLAPQCPTTGRAA